MSITPFDELLDLANRKDLAEVGGGHNQKGVEFQRHWAVMRMFELEQQGEKDFLLLFEAIQDVAILDSATAPTSICIYQIKKKDRKEWGWAELTSLHHPIIATNSSKPVKPKARSAASKPVVTKPLSDVQSSPLGKLYAAVLAVKELKSTGRFVSNAGCDVPLADGTNAATSRPCAISALSTEHADLLSKALQTIHASGTSVPDLSRIYIERVVLPVDDPGTLLVGRVHDFLLQRSPRHAGQARAIVDSLVMTIGRLGAKTDHCKTFDEMRRQRGYSRGEFVDALGQLEVVPDLLAHLDTWLSRLAEEGFGFLDIMSIRSAATSIYRRKVMGSRSPDEERFMLACDAWLLSRPDPTQLKPFFEAAYQDLSQAHTGVKRSEFFAHFALRAIQRCVDQI